MHFVLVEVAGYISYGLGMRLDQTILVFCLLIHCNHIGVLVVSAPDPNQPQHGSLPVDVIRAGVGLGLGPRLECKMTCATIDLKLAHPVVMVSAIDALSVSVPE